jgi:hypothetical protein
MTTANALTFIDRGLEDSALRERLNAAATLQERDNVLAEEDLVFSDHHFEEAYYHRLTQCREPEAADQLNEFKMWWELLAQFLEPAGCSSLCGDCCH